MLRYPRVGVTVKSDLPHKDEVEEVVLRTLKKAGARVFIDRDRFSRISEIKGLSDFSKNENIDLLLVIGGDGTILRAVREMQNFSAPILSVNRGNVGFLAEMSDKEVPALLPKFLKGDGIIEERSVLHVTAHRGKKLLEDALVLNEAVIAQGSIARLIDLKTTVNGEPLTTFRSDGLIIATPTGSTAYTLAAGGPIVDPHLAALILTPINPYSFNQKPVVMPASHRIEVEVLPRQPKKFGDVEVSLTLDGQRYVRLQHGDKVTAVINDHTVKFLRRKRETFYTTLRTKLQWGEGPEE